MMQVKVLMRETRFQESSLNIIKNYSALKKGIEHKLY